MDQGDSSMDSALIARCTGPPRIKEILIHRRFASIVTAVSRSSTSSTSSPGRPRGRGRRARGGCGLQPRRGRHPRGRLHDRWPATFPSGQGSDFAGVVAEVGPGVDGVAVGDESSASRTTAPATPSCRRRGARTSRHAPRGAVGGGRGAVRRRHDRYAAVRAVGFRRRRSRDLRRRRRRRDAGRAAGAPAGATVIGLASEAHHDWLRDHGAFPVTYGDGVAERIRDAAAVSSTPSSIASAQATSTWPSSSASRRTHRHHHRLGRGAAPRREDRRQYGRASADEFGRAGRLIADGRLESRSLASTRSPRSARLQRAGARHTLGKIVLRP